MERKYHFAYTTNKLDTVDAVLEVIDEVSYWAYIVHDSPAENKPHVHFYMKYGNARTLSAVAKELGVAENMIEIIRAPKAYLAYLTHTDRKSVKAGKPQYPKEKIVANFDVATFGQKPETLTIDDLKREWRDYVKVKKGWMTMDEFMERHGVYIVRHSINNRFAMYDRLLDNPSGYALIHDSRLADLDDVPPAVSDLFDSS